MSLYVQAHQDLMSHRKTRRLARILKIPLTDAVGRLIFMWWWGLSHAQDGLLKCDAQDIADIVMWEGDAEELLDALINCGGAGAGFIDRDEDGRLSLHDWNEHCKIFEERAKARERAGKKKPQSAKPQPTKCEENLPQTAEIPRNSAKPSETSRNSAKLRPEIEIENEIETEMKTETEKNNIHPKGAAPAAKITLPPTPLPTSLPAEPLSEQPPLPFEEPTTPPTTVPSEPEPEIYPVADAPRAMRPTAEYLLMKTGRIALTETELSALRTLEAHHVPARVQAEIDKAVERFKQRGRPLNQLRFDYIANTGLKYQETRAPSGRRRTTPVDTDTAFPEHAPLPIFTDEDIAALEAGLASGLTQ